MAKQKEKFECTCEGCKNACSYVPGWFMPGEAEKAAEHLDLSLEEFFNKYLGVNWWEDEEDIFVLAPAIIGEKTGSEYPGDPKGKCIFFNDKELCDIHVVKPFECAELICNDTKINERHEAVAIAWKNHQKQIVELLGRQPEAKAYYGGILSRYF